MGRHALGLVDDGQIEFAHLALARLLEAGGDPEAALRALRRRVQYLGWQPYLAASLREEGRLATAVGDLEGALRAWEHYLGSAGIQNPPWRRRWHGSAPRWRGSAPGWKRGITGWNGSATGWAGSATQQTVGGDAEGRRAHYPRP
jgi:hypothetical protein